MTQHYLTYQHQSTLGVPCPKSSSSSLTMSAETGRISSSPEAIRIDVDPTTAIRRDETRVSPTLRRFDRDDDEEARERQRAMDVDSAMQLGKTHTFRHRPA